MGAAGFLGTPCNGRLLAVVGLVGLVVAVSAGAAPVELFEKYGDGGRDFVETETSSLRVHFHQRTIGEAIVEKDYIVYQLDKDTSELVARKSHWRNDLPDALPAGLMSQDVAELLVDGDVLFSRLYYISPESDVFPLDPTPENPCWVVRSLGEHEEQIITIIDAVSGVTLGNGVPPPYTAFSLTGPWYFEPCSGGWTSWSGNAEAWFNSMGYSTEEVLWPTQTKIQSHIQSDETAMFYELAHGGSNYFASGCVNDEYAEYTYASEIEAWIAGYNKMPFAFIGSCAGMCSTGDGTFAYEFRKGESLGTTVVGYCGMSEPQCDTCWGYSLDWQDTLFYHMSQGETVWEAYEAANAAYAICAGTNDCMRFAGDQDFEVVPVVPRVADCNTNGVPDGDDIDYGTSDDCNTNRIPDECEPDCNSNTVADSCDITEGTSPDCNNNDVPDECDLAGGTSPDCQPNYIPDECETDCNENGVPDDCDLSGGTSSDCNNNLIPDWCDINYATSTDCNSNAVPDECDLAAGSSYDCNTNMWPDECDISGGTSNDCQPNGVPDECDLAGGSEDYNTNGVPDECEAREIQNVGSCHNHGSAGEFCVDLGIGSGYRVSGDNVEPRQGGVNNMVFDLNLPVWFVIALVDCQYHTYNGTITPLPDGTPTLGVEFDPALPNNDCCTIRLYGDVRADYAVAVLLGDADRNLDVNSLDYSAVKLRLAQPVDETNARYDINADGDITSLDYSSIKLNLGVVLPACP